MFMGLLMASTPAKHKHFVLDQQKIKRAQKVLGARTETEAIEQALDEVIEQRRRNAGAWRAHLRFLREGIRRGIKIKDVYGKLVSHHKDTKATKTNIRREGPGGRERGF